MLYRRTARSTDKTHKTKLKSKKRITTQQNDRSLIGESISGGSQLSIVLCIVNCLYPSVLSDMCTCYSKRFKLNQELAELLYKFNSEEADERGVISGKYRCKGDDVDQEGLKLMNVDVRPLLLLKQHDDKSKMEDRDCSKEDDQVRWLIESNVSQILKQFLNDNDDKRMRREYPWIKKLLKAFLVQVLTSEQSKFVMLPVMGQFELNTDFWVSKKRPSRAIRIHPLTQCVKRLERVDEILKWKMQCQLVDRTNFFLMMTKLFLDYVLYQNFHLVQCREMMDQIIQLMSHRNFTHTFYLLNMNVTSKDYLLSILLPSKRLMSELISYHLPILASKVELWGRNAVMKRLEESSQSEKKTSDHSLFYSIQHLARWMKEQNPKTKQERLDFKRRTISNMLFLKFNPLNYSMPEKPLSTTDTNAIQHSFYSIFQNAAMERDNNFRRMQFIEKSKLKEVSDTVYEQLKEKIENRRRRLVAFKIQYLKYLNIQQQLQSSQNQLECALSDIQDDYSNEFNRLFTIYVQSSSSIHIKDSLVDMSQGLAERLQHVLIKHKMSSIIKWMNRLANPSNQFYHGVDQFREQFMILNVHGNQSHDYAHSILYFCQFLKGYTSSQTKIQKLSDIQTIIRALIQKCKTSAGTTTDMSLETLTRELRLILDASFTLRYRYLLFGPFIHQIASINELKKTFFDIIRARSIAKVQRVTVRYERNYQKRVLDRDQSFSL